MATQTESDLLIQVHDLTLRLAEAQDTLNAIGAGEVDALVVGSGEKHSIYTLEGADTVYRVVFGALNEGALTLSPDLTIVAANTRFSTLIETPLSRILGKSFSQFVAPESIGRFQMLVATGERRHSRQEILLVAGDVRKVPVLASFNKAELNNGVSVYVLVVTDLTELRKAQQELKRSNEELENRVAERTAQLENASHAKDHFIAALSHELRNPLAPVITAVSLLRKDESLSGRGQHLVDMIQRNVELQARLIDDLLDLNRIAHGKVELNKERVELCGIIERAAEVCRADIEARHLHFGIDFGPRPYLIEADAGRLQQVFWNLLKNAVKFTPPGGCVGVRCRRESGSVLVEVNDSGIGIPPDDVTRIFDAFAQAERSKKQQQFGGLGLGLAISKMLVEIHGGTIEAESAGEDKGATFKIRLPLVAFRERSNIDVAAFPPERHAPDHRQLRILLVEDHGDTAELMASILEQEGHHVQMAADVTTALQLAASDEFDLLVSNLGLPDRSGLDLLRELRSRGNNVRAIALSGYGQESDVQQSRAAGFQNHLIKPVDIDRFLEVVEAAPKS